MHREDRTLRPVLSPFMPRDLVEVAARDGRSVEPPPECPVGFPVRGGDANQPPHTSGDSGGRRMTQRSKTLSVVALAAAAGLALAGCGKSNTASPSSSEHTTASSATSVAATTTTDSTSSQWDPCTVPDSTISDLGLDTSTKSDQLSGTSFDGWKICGWKSADKTYNFTAYTSRHTLDEFKQRTDFGEFAPTTVSNHQALRYRSTGDDHDLGCSIAVQVKGGTVDFDVLNRYGTAGAGDPCTQVRHLADGLARYLPGT
jgi:Protein of unknown function (DUF3558)